MTHSRPCTIKDKGKGKAVELPLSEDDHNSFDELDESDLSGSEFEPLSSEDNMPLSRLTEGMQGSDEDVEVLMVSAVMELSRQTARLENQHENGAGPSSRPTAKKRVRKARSTQRRATKRTNAKKKYRQEEPENQKDDLFDSLSELSVLTDDDELLAKSISKANSSGERMSHFTSLEERRQIRKEEMALAMRLGRRLTMVNSLPSFMCSWN